MPAQPIQQITLLTPTYAGDLDRFRLQRESIESCGIELPHVAMVNHEDLPRFRDIPHQKGLTLVSTRDVLPASIERRRLLWGVRRRDPRRWFSGKPIHGWAVQQYLKLSAPRVVQSGGLVCIDCDTIFLGRVTAADFQEPGGKMHLYETSDDVDAEMAEWVGRSMRFLGVKASHKPVVRYTHSPVVFDRQVLLDLISHIEKRHGRHWIEAIEAFGMVMEYSTYGVFARWIDAPMRVTPMKPALTAYFWWPEEAAAIEANLVEKVKKTGARILAVQSNAGVPPQRYRALVASLWPAS